MTWMVWDRVLTGDDLALRLHEDSNTIVPFPGGLFPWLGFLSPSWQGVRIMDEWVTVMSVWF